MNTSYVATARLSGQRIVDFFQAGSFFGYREHVPDGEHEARHGWDIVPAESVGGYMERVVAALKLPLARDDPHYAPW